MPHIIYTSHDCPFCARAMTALKYAGIKTEVRTADFNNMPEEAKKVIVNPSVPLLVLDNGTVIDESWDIVKWALNENDPDNWLGDNHAFVFDTEMLVETYDHSFYSDYKTYRDDPTSKEKRDECEEYLEELEEVLNEQSFLLANQISVADISIIAFIRLLSNIEPEWFDSLPYPKCQQWLKTITALSCFKSTLLHHELWQTNDSPIYL